MRSGFERWWTMVCGNDWGGGSWFCSTSLTRSRSLMPFVVEINREKRTNSHLSSNTSEGYKMRLIKWLMNSFSQKFHLIFCHVSMLINLRYMISPKKISPPCEKWNWGKYESFELEMRKNVHCDELTHHCVLSIYLKYHLSCTLITLKRDLCGN